MLYPRETFTDFIVQSLDKYGKELVNCLNN